MVEKCIGKQELIYLEEHVLIIHPFAFTQFFVMWICTKRVLFTLCVMSVFNIVSAVGDWTFHQLFDLCLVSICHFSLFFQVALLGGSYTFILVCVCTTHWLVQKKCVYVLGMTCSGSVIVVVHFLLLLDSVFLSPPQRRYFLVLPFWPAVRVGLLTSYFQTTVLTCLLPHVTTGILLCVSLTLLTLGGLCLFLLLKLFSIAV